MDVTDSIGPGKLVHRMQNPSYTYDEYYATDWHQVYRPSYAKIRHTMVRHIQVHLYFTEGRSASLADGMNWNVAYFVCV